MPIRLMENFRAVFYAPYYATQALGFYEHEGVEIELQDLRRAGRRGAQADRRHDRLTWGGPMRVMKAHDQDQHRRWSASARWCRAIRSS